MPNVQAPTSVRDSYDRQKRVAELLKVEVDQLLANRPSEWHVTSRVKSPDSFIEKLQTGRVRDQDQMEDVFAATIVVPNRAELTVAEDYVSEFMLITERRPPKGPTKQSASDFRFDDIRLYGHLHAPDSLPVGPIHHMMFEVQVKTFLQHAWGIATHDTVYKTDRTSWARNRMAYQIRALLEHAEAAVDAIDVYDMSTTSASIGAHESRVQATVDFIVEHWDPDFHPASLIRAGENIISLCSDLKVESVDFMTAMGDKLAADGLPLGWSPYEYALEVASLRYPTELKQHLLRRDIRARVYYVTNEILSRLGLAPSGAPSARL